MKTWTRTETTLGTVLMVAGRGRLNGLYIEGQKHQPPMQDSWQYDPQLPLFVEARRQLQEYLDGRRRHFELPLAPRGTEFQQQVWQALQQIPYGEIRRYGELASAMGKASATRAVGAAIGRNPLSIIVPCHRVIGASGSLTGFASGIERKRKLLQLEGAEF